MTQYKKMLTLFNNITEQLTDLEKKILAPMLLELLRDTHEDRRITGKRISDWFKMAGYSSVSEVRVRKLINYIRVMNMAHPKVLIGASTGYFLTEFITVIDKQIESMQGRVDSQVAVIDSFKAQRENLKRLQR